MCQKIELPLIGIPLFGYGFMILLGFLTASWLCRREAEKRGLPGEKIFDLMIFIVLAGVVGARIFYVVQFYDEFFSGEPWYKVFAIWTGGLVFYGGFLAAFFAGWWYLKRNKLPVLRVLDTCAAFLPVGMAFGRIGCWLNGCCWGWRCKEYLPELLNRFPVESAIYQAHLASGYVSRAAEKTASVQPIQLFDSMHSWVIFLLLWWNLRCKHPEGTVTFLFVVLYGMGRFTLELLRGDHHVVYGTITVSQGISLAMIAGGIAGIVWAYRRKRAGTDPVGKTEPQRA